MLGARRPTAEWRQRESEGAQWKTSGNSSQRVT